jgi:SAM-dependent methyltransferase
MAESRREREQVRRVFNDVAATYDRTRPGYPDDVFTDLIAITRLPQGALVLEVACGTGQATASLARLGFDVTAVELGAELADVARERLAGFPNVTVETANFEHWHAAGRRFDAVVSATAWHWIDPAIRWERAHDLLREGGWLALIATAVVRDPSEPEVYAETAEIHERFAPGNPEWGHPPTAPEVIAGVASATDDMGALQAKLERSGDGRRTAGLFTPPEVRWYPLTQWFDGAGYADLMRTTSLYRRLDDDVREGLLNAIAAHIRDYMGDAAARRYLVNSRVAQRIG